MNTKVNRVLAAITFVTGVASTPAGATVIFDTWQSNESPNGDYLVTVEEDGGNDRFNVSVTVDPWNAEALGFFVDFGDADIGETPTLYDVSPSGEVTVHSVDTMSSDCGTGCNLDGLGVESLLDEGDSEWELVFRVGQQGFDDIRTFSWSFDTFGFGESDWNLVGIRAQQLCDGDDTLNEGDEGCGDSDKVYGTPTINVPEPMVMATLLLGLAGIGFSRFARKLLD